MLLKLDMNNTPDETSNRSLGYIGFSFALSLVSHRDRKILTAFNKIVDINISGEEAATRTSPTSIDTTSLYVRRYLYDNS